MNDSEHLEFILLGNLLLEQSKNIRKFCQIVSDKVDPKKEHDMYEVLVIDLLLAIELTIKAVLYFENTNPPTLTT